MMLLAHISTMIVPKKLVQRQGTRPARMNPRIFVLDTLSKLPVYLISNKVDYNSKLALQDKSL